MLAQLAYDERSWDETIRALSKADSLGTFSPVPLPLQRLNVLLNAHRFEEAMALGDSVAPRGGRGVSVPTPLLGSVVASYLLTRGRVAEASVLHHARVAELQRFESSPDLANQFGLAGLTLDFRLASRSGTVTAAEAAAIEAKVKRFLAELPAPARAPLEHRAAYSMIIGGAELGDTAMVARWRRVLGNDSLLSYDARAAARAGDLHTARRLYARAVADTATDVGHLVSLAMTADALGRPAEALQHLTRLDSARVEAGSMATDWLLLARAKPYRAALAASLGDTASARRLYDEFLALWEGADSGLLRERASVEAARKALDSPGEQQREPGDR
jgi:tetratricopeptide (TPR) repeat protein